MPDPNTLSLPDNASLFTRLRVATQCLQVLQHDPANPTCGQLLNICLDGKVYASLVQQLQRFAGKQRSDLADVFPRAPPGREEAELVIDESDPARVAA